jgi:hypothetical protein
MCGGGETEIEAVKKLHENFENYKRTGKKLPRPGRRVQIEFAATDRIASHAALREDFVRRVLELKWAWISDESSLWDFPCDETNAQLFEKIRLIYKVDVSDISSGNLADIFDRIRNSVARAGRKN